MVDLPDEVAALKAIATISATEEAYEVTPKPAASSLRVAHCGSLPKHLPGVEEVIEPEPKVCTCGGGFALDWRRRLGTPRRDPGLILGDRDPPSGVRLPFLLERCRASSGSGASDPWWHADRGDGSACAGLQICQSPATLPTGADLQPPRYRSGPINSRRLDRKSGQ
jgi:hypothetical protein